LKDLLDFSGIYEIFLGSMEFFGIYEIF